MTTVAPPIRAYAGDLREVFRNPVAMIVALIGTVLLCGLASMLALYLGQDCVKVFNEAWAAQGHERFNPTFLEESDAECGEDAACIRQMELQWIEEDKALYALDYQLAVTEACPAETDEDEFEIEFEPGALVRLGQEIEEKELPEKIITQETREEEETVAETVTEDEEAKPAEEPPPEPEEKPKKPDKPPPKEKKDKKLPTSKMPTQKNTPYKDLPTVDYQKGDPFGDPGGWSDLAKDGDPWATAVMKALNNMEIGAYAAKGGAGDFKFQLVLCKDGSIKQVSKKGGSLEADGQNAVVLALDRLKLPKPPPAVAKKMSSNCARIKYTFVWSARGVK